MPDAQHASILAHLHAMEKAAAERHAEVLRRIAQVEDAAQCANLAASEVSDRLGCLLAE